MQQFHLLSRVTKAIQFRFPGYTDKGFGTVETVCRSRGGSWRLSQLAWRNKVSRIDGHKSECGSAGSYAYICPHMHPHMHTRTETPTHTDRYTHTNIHVHLSVSLSLSHSVLFVLPLLMHIQNVLQCMIIDISEETRPLGTLLDGRWHNRLTTIEARLKSVTLLCSF